MAVILLGDGRRRWRAEWCAAGPFPRFVQKNTLMLPVFVRWTEVDVCLLNGAFEVGVAQLPEISVSSLLMRAWNSPWPVVEIAGTSRSRSSCSVIRLKPP